MIHVWVRMQDRVSGMEEGNARERVLGSGAVDWESVNARGSGREVRGISTERGNGE